MTSSTVASAGSSGGSGGFLWDGVTPARDLRKSLATRMASASATDVDLLSLNVLHELVDDIVLGMCFDVHRAVKTGVFSLTEIPERESHASSSNAVMVDVFGQAITTSLGVPTLKKQPECVCPNCQRNMAASRFAPHLEKCMGMGRNSSRLASRRLATSSCKESYRETRTTRAEDEDWVEPGVVVRGPAGGPGVLGPGGPAAVGGAGGNSRRRQRDKNSPRRNKMGGGNGSKSSGKTSGETTPQEGSITPPSNFDQLSLEERSHWLRSICGVVSTSSSRKICTRSTRCPVHTDAQRREVRIRWLSSLYHGGSLEGGGTGEETHVDIDSFTEGDTAALRESLAQLSNASSPAESVISTCSNPGGISQSSSGFGGSSTRSGRREKSSRRGNKKGKSGSKGGSSRGSTPPIMME